MVMLRCELCPVPPELRCPAFQHRRFCDLLAMGRLDYVPVLLAMARNEVSSPPPIDVAARRAAKPRLPLGVPHCRPCVEQAKREGG